MAVNYIDILKKTCDRTISLAMLNNIEDDPKYSTRWARWDWPVGVAFYGAWKAYELLKDENIIHNMKAWIDLRVDSRIDSININTTAPMNTVLNLYKRFGDKKYEQIMRFFDNYLVYFGLRTPCGALSHTVIGKHRPDQIWADTLFMGVLYMAQRGVYLKNDYYIKEVIKDIMLHGEYLLDKKTNLFYHGWHDAEKKFIGVRWGRGNSWITASLVEILEIINSDFPEKKKILELLNNQVEALSKLQRPDGLWTTVLDHPETYPEVSVAAGVAYGVLKGIRLGYIDAKYKAMALKAVEGVISNIDDKGDVQKASGGTPIFDTAEDYDKVPYEVTPFSQGLALMALSEAAVCK